MLRLEAFPGFQCTCLHFCKWHERLSECSTCSRRKVIKCPFGSTPVLGLFCALNHQFRVGDFNVGLQQRFYHVRTVHDLKKTYHSLFTTFESRQRFVLQVVSLIIADKSAWLNHWVVFLGILRFGAWCKSNRVVPIQTSDEQGLTPGFEGF